MLPMPISQTQIQDFGEHVARTVRDCRSPGLKPAHVPTLPFCKHLATEATPSQDQLSASVCTVAARARILGFAATRFGLDHGGPPSNLR
jgi:hypothetical protein